MVTEIQERYSKLENLQLKTEELLNASKLEILSLKNIIHNLETRVESLIKNEMLQKNTINQLTNVLEEEQNNQQDMLIEVSSTYYICTLFLIKTLIIIVKSAEKSIRRTKSK